MRKLFFALLLLITVVAHSQELRFDFDDLDLTSWEQGSPNHWHVDTIHPIQGRGSLHHMFDTNESSMDAIAFPHTQVRLDSGVTTWQFRVRHEYNPSSGNNWAIWLTSLENVSRMKPTEQNEGYVLGVNYSGSDDLIKLWKHSGTVKSVVLNSYFNWQEEIGTKKAAILQINRSIDGEWEVLIDTSEAGFYSIGSAVDTTFNQSENLGIYYKYTSTQDQKLWIDDFSLNGFFYTDTESPKIIETRTVEQNQIELTFNESIDTTIEMFFVLNRAHYPAVVQWQSSLSVVLTYEQTFEENNLLEVYQLTDKKGNQSAVESIRFNYYIPSIQDIILNEIFADPSPSVGMPDCEFVELFNRSDKPLNLFGWSFSSGSRDPVFLPSFVFEPETYLVLTGSSCLDDFSDTINLLGFSDFPALPNYGEKLILKDRYGKIIHSIQYSNKWYLDEAKEEGGYSLELIDNNYPCITTNNWRASSSSSGGTPGTTNSYSGEIIDYPYARLVTIENVQRTACELIFNESLDSSSAANASNYTLENTDIQITPLPVSPDYKLVELHFHPALEYARTYKLILSSQITDCAGIGIGHVASAFGIPQEPDSADLLITEILFEASEEVPEFIEIFNNSGKVIDLQNYHLISFDPYTDTIKSVKQITSTSFQLMPGNYLALTENVQLLLSRFEGIDQENLLQTASWITLSNEVGKTGIQTNQDKILDIAVYAPEMHFNLLDNTKGVSLERISNSQPGTQPKNWHSASTNSGYATPGKVNSQSLMNSEIEATVFSFHPESISPDNNGIDDFITVTLRFSKPGFLSTVKIFSQQGILIKDIINNELCGTEEQYVWDGLGADNERLAMGYYIMLFEAWHPDGERLRDKRAVLVLPEKK
jgi:hypothetical protein